MDLVRPISFKDLQQALRPEDQVRIYWSATWTKAFVVKIRDNSALFRIEKGGKTHHVSVRDASHVSLIPKPKPSQDKKNKNQLSLL